MKIRVVIFSAMLMSLGLSAQDDTDYGGNLSPEERAYSPGNFYLNAGVNFLYGNLGPRLISTWSNYNYSSTPPVVLSGEFGFHELFSIGGFLGYRQYSWDYVIGSGFYEYKHAHTVVGARGSFHYVPLLNEHLDTGLDEDKFDFYVTVVAGLSFVRESRREPSFRRTKIHPGGVFGPLLGFRYMFNNTLGIYVEGGRGSMGYANIGLTLKL